MILHVDPADPTPVYEQIRAQLALMIASGVLPTGTRLPTIRQLANDLGLAKGTVARAYELLTRDGLAAAQGRRGTTVMGAPAHDRDPTADHEIADAARRYAVRASQLGLDRHDALDAVRRQLDELGI